MSITKAYDDMNANLGAMIRGPVTETTATVATAAGQVLAENADRKFLVLQNRGAQALYISFGGTAGSDKLKLAVDEKLVLQPAPTNAISAISADAVSGTSLYIAEA